MSMRGSAVTLSGHAHERIRSDILSGRLGPGQPLRLVAMADELDVSRAVVREALTLLSGEGLVTAAPNQGFRVVGLSEEDLADLTDLRVTLECRALERSIALGDVAWEGLVVSTHHVLERAPLPDPSDPAVDPVQWMRAHAAFHDALSSACGRPRLLALVRSLRDGAEVYRQWSARPGIEHGRDVVAEHRTLMELATARRTDEACAALREHLETTTRLVLAARQAVRSVGP